MPVFVWQTLAFVSPGLTRREKRWAYPIVLGASLMFVLGCAFAFYIELPPALNFLLDGGDVATPFISVKSYVDFVTRLMLVTGLVFETPFLVMGLAKVGLVTSSKLLQVVAVRDRGRLHRLGDRHAVDRPDYADARGGTDDRPLLRGHRDGTPGRENADHPALLTRLKAPARHPERSEGSSLQSNPVPRHLPISLYQLIRLLDRPESRC